jgi:hypothetical protein
VLWTEAGAQTLVAPDGVPLANPAAG